jgi:hypothetical protein
MYSRSLIGISTVSLLFLLPSGAVAQQKLIKDQLVGAWTVLSDDGVKDDGTHVPVFGPNPIGSFIFTPNGRYSFHVMRTTNRPRFASGNGQNGTPEEFKAAVQGAVSHFGTYTVDEADRSYTLYTEGSSVPNLEGGRQKLQIKVISDDVLSWTVPTAATSIPPGTFEFLEHVWKKTK